LRASATKRRLGSVSYLPVEDILPSPMQPRQFFSRAGLEELSRSIAEVGVLQPLSVRPKGARYELIAGERRLRAAKMAGLTEVPCVVLDADLEESGILALIENIQRRDLDFIEEAEGIARLIRLFGLSQEQAARRLGKSQSAVANKLRLLRLPSDVLELMHLHGLTERHGRALLRLPTAELQRTAARTIAEKALTVSAAEAYVDRLLAGEPAPRRQSTRLILKDLGIFLNSLSKNLDLMRQGGIDAKMQRQETESETVVTIRIPKKPGP